MPLIDTVKQNPNQVLEDPEKYAKDEEAKRLFLDIASKNATLARRAIDAKFLAKLCLSDAAQKQFLVAIAQLKDEEIREKINNCQILSSFVAKHAILHLFFTLNLNAQNEVSSAPNSLDRPIMKSPFRNLLLRERAKSLGNEIDQSQADYKFALLKMKTSVVMMLDNVIKLKSDTEEYQGKKMPYLELMNFLTKAANSEEKDRPTKQQVVVSLSKNFYDSYELAYDALVLKCIQIKYEIVHINREHQKRKSSIAGSETFGTLLQEFDLLKAKILPIIDGFDASDCNKVNSADEKLAESWHKHCNDFDTIIGFKQLSLLSKDKDFTQLKCLLSEANALVAFCNLFVRIKVDITPSKRMTTATAESVKAEQHPAVELKL
jgi:hypothetical protein